MHGSLVISTLLDVIEAYIVRFISIDSVVGNFLQKGYCLTSDCHSVGHA